MQTRREGLFVLARLGQLGAGVPQVDEEMLEVLRQDVADQAVLLVRLP